MTHERGVGSVEVETLAVDVGSRLPPAAALSIDVRNDCVTRVDRLAETCTTATISTGQRLRILLMADEAFVLINADFSVFDSFSSAGTLLRVPIFSIASSRFKSFFCRLRSV